MSGTDHTKEMPEQEDGSSKAVQVQTEETSESNEVPKTPEASASGNEQTPASPEDAEHREKRDRRLTEKMQALQDQENQKRASRFQKAYDKWKTQMRETRIRLKQECVEEELGVLMEKVASSESAVLQIYNDIRSHGAPNQETKRRMDACSAVTRDVTSLLQHRLAEVGEEWNDQAERQRLHSLLDRESAQSIYGSLVNHSIAASSFSIGRSHHSNNSDVSSIAAKRADTAANIAAKEAELKDIKEAGAEKARLEHQLKCLETQKEIRVAKAKMSVYDKELEHLTGNGNGKRNGKPDQISHLGPTQTPDPKVRTPLSPSAAVFSQRQTPILPTMVDPTPYTEPAFNVNQPIGDPTPYTEPAFNVNQPIGQPVTDYSMLAHAFQSSMALGRLPLPEPTIFNGDPLQYTEWKASFTTLIDNKTISPQEKFYFLKKYAGKEAGKALQGYYLSHTESSYEGAWKTLEERYGNPFTLQKAFRQKLNNWTTINPTDAEGLRDYSDFLQGCQKAMQHIPSLKVLNDCMENQRLAAKLPTWAVTRWNRKATQKLQETGDYPSFDYFVEFVVGEAKVACNPVSSLHALNEDKRTPRDPKRKQASVMATTTDFQNTHKDSQNQGKDTQGATKNNSPNNHKDSQNQGKDGHSKWKPVSRETKEITKKCPFCESDGHYLPNCPKFVQESLADRRKFIQDQRRCYGCLRTGHGSKTCEQRHTCRTCKGKHPTCLHDNDFQPRKETEASSSNAEKASALNTNGKGESTITSTIVPVWVSTEVNPHKETLVYALLDTQSNTTFVDQTISDSLNAASEPVKLKLTTMTDRESDVPCERVTGLRVRGYTSNIMISIPSAYTRDLIPSDPTHIPTNETAKSWPHLRPIANEVPPLLDCEVGLLIGYNCAQALVPREVIAGKDDEPFAVRMDLGWSIVGRASPAASCFTISGFCHRTSARESPHLTPTDALRVLEKDFQDTEASDQTLSQLDIQFLETLESGIQQTPEGHYQMPLPFTKRPTLPNNRLMATHRLNHLKRKLEKDSTYHEEYTNFMTGLLEREEAEKVPETADGPQWYIPHHGVYHRRKGKLRVVFDCSAKYQGTSLNDHLLVGPDLINNLVGVLCRFRINPVALMCDIEKMFHQFKVNAEDRNFLQFLWWEGGDLSTQPQTYRMKVHLFGAASSPGCANYGLKYLATANKHTLPVGANFIHRDFYVDDGLSSEPTEERAIQVIEEARALCAKGNLRLHKFVSNRRAVMETIPAAERATNVQDLNLSFNNLPTESALGLQWSVNNDTLSFSCPSTEHPLSRRGLLATVASLYDPLGLIAPYILQGKQILQAMCHKGIGWDDPLPQELCQRWEIWRADLQFLKQIEVPRCYHPGFTNIQNVQLHHFSDASTTGYGMCTYLRLQNDQGHTHCSLVGAKARVAPTKITTVPRLELSAALVSAEVGTMLKQELDIAVNEEFFWTDSKVVLGYINNDVRKFHIFVANRVQKIRQLTDPKQWHYVPTTSNPADHASRGLSAKDIPNTSWFSGPSFLWKNDLDIPHESAPELRTGDPEVRNTVTLKTQASASTSAPLDWNERLAHCSTWSNALRAVARILRLAERTKTHDRQLSAAELRKAEAITTKGPDQLTVHELEAAELRILQGVQQQAFSQERKLLSGDPKTPLPNSSKLARLDPFLEGGLIRVGGRLRKAPTSINERHQIVLPGRGHVTNLIITHYHKKIQHQGRGITLNEIHSHGYWILGGGHAVAKHIYKCVTCRRVRRPKETQRMADLPRERLEPSPPFTFSGMDCFGPFVSKNGRKEAKRYGLLFTCLCSRAIHIEMLEDLTTDSFINGLRCFIAIRGTVTQIRSDQGTNFVGAKNVFKQALKELDTNKLNHFLTHNQCEFMFNVPGSSHAGGIWERQIRSVRNVLEITTSLCPGRLDDSSLRTLFYEAMAIVNSRPLTVSTINDPTAPEPLTPNHILTMKSAIPLPPPGDFVKEDMYLRKRWRRVQFLAEQFWARWKKEYLHNISLRQKWHVPRRNLKVGDVVLIDQNTNRNEWPLGLVIEACKSDDGLVRKVKLSVGSRELDKKGRRMAPLSVLERPVQKVVLLMETE